MTSHNHSSSSSSSGVNSQAKWRFPAVETRVRWTPLTIRPCFAWIVTVALLSGCSAAADGYFLKGWTWIHVLAKDPNSVSACISALLFVCCLSFFCRYIAVFSAIEGGPITSMFSVVLYSTLDYSHVIARVFSSALAHSLHTMLIRLFSALLELLAIYML